MHEKNESSKGTRAPNRSRDVLNCSSLLGTTNTRAPNGSHAKEHVAILDVRYTIQTIYYQPIRSISKDA